MTESEFCAQRKTKRIMNDNEVIADHLSPCVRIFIESLLHGHLKTSGDNAGETEKSELKKGSDRPSSLKARSPR